MLVRASLCLLLTSCASLSATVPSNREVSAGELAALVAMPGCLVQATPTGVVLVEPDREGPSTEERSAYLRWDLERSRSQAVAAGELARDLQRGRVLRVAVGADRRSLELGLEPRVCTTPEGPEATKALVGPHCLVVSPTAQDREWLESQQSRLASALR